MTECTFKPVLSDHSLNMAVSSSVNGLRSSRSYDKFEQLESHRESSRIGGISKTPTNVIGCNRDELECTFKP